MLAKLPLPGLAKTRLIPALGADGAAALALRLLERALDAAFDAAVGPVELCVAPDPQHPVLAALAARPGLRLARQPDGDLGERMAARLEAALRRTPHALLLGTDAPALTPARLREAAATLATHDAVFVPALDGGYALVGLARPARALFDGMAWSTPQVMQHTRERAAGAGLRWAELDAVADIDEPADLVHLPPGWHEG